MVDAAMWRFIASLNHYRSRKGFGEEQLGNWMKSYPSEHSILKSRFDLTSETVANVIAEYLKKFKDVNRIPVEMFKLADINQNADNTMWQTNELVELLSNLKHTRNHMEEEQTKRNIPMRSSLPEMVNLEENTSPDENDDENSSDRSSTATFRGLTSEKTTLGGFTTATTVTEPIRRNHNEERESEESDTQKGHPFSDPYPYINNRPLPSYIPQPSMLPSYAATHYQTTMKQMSLTEPNNLYHPFSTNDYRIESQEAQHTKPNRPSVVKTLFVPSDEASSDSESRIKRPKEKRVKEITQKQRKMTQNEEPRYKPLTSKSLLDNERRKRLSKPRQIESDDEVFTCKPTKTRKPKSTSDTTSDSEQEIKINKTKTTKPTNTR